MHHNSTSCDRDESDIVWNEIIILPLGASISILSYFLIFYLYYYLKVPTLKRHPTSLGVRKCVFELIFVSQYLWVPFAPDTFLWSDENDCVASKWAAFFAFITQVSLFGSELWFFVLTMDLHFACTNPFTSYKLFARRYEIFVFLGSVGTASLLVAAGPKVYGTSSDSTIWIQSTSHDDGGAKYNVAKVLLFYCWMVIIYTYCLYVMWYVYRRLKQGVSQTLHARLSTVRRAQSYVLGYSLGYTIFWLFPFVLSFMDYIGVGDRPLFRSLVGFLLAVRGLFSALILLIPNWSELKAFLYSKRRNASEADGLVQNVVEEDLSLRPHLNSVLRAEIIFFTTQGIRLAAKEAFACGRMSKLNAGGNKSNGANTIALVEEQSKSFSQKFKRKSKSGKISESSVRSFNSASLTQASGMDASSFQDDLLKIEEQQRESIAALNLADELDDALDFIGLHEEPSKRTHSVEARENSINVIDNPVLARNGVSSVDDTKDPSKLSGSSNSARFSEAEFRLQVDTESQNWSRSQRESTNVPLTSRERIKKNLLSVATQTKDAVLSELGNATNDFIFKDYLPHLFAEVRESCGIDAAEYAASFQNITKEKFSEGRSGAFLYFSSDQKYIVKTTSKAENQVLLDMMNDYVGYLIANPNSLIVRFLGAHSIKMYNRVLYFVVMQNVFSNANLSERYDLKGSWVNRHGDRLRRRHKAKLVPLYKDNDLQHKIALHPSVIYALHDQILRDSSFLSGLGLMDYSLLVGVVQRRFEVMERPSTQSVLSLKSDSNDPFMRDEDGGMHVTVVEGPGTYFMGIIDVLQHWNWEKKLERFMKIVFKFEDGDGLSAIDPTRYADRFIKGCVIDAFEGLDSVSLDDYNPKNKYHSKKNYTPPDEDDVLRMSERNKSGTDKRFAASPLESSMI